MVNSAMPWFAVRSVYLFGRKSDGTNIFEERIVCFEGASYDEAFEKAERESDAYVASASFKDFEVFEVQDAYEQDGDPLIDGYEVYSKLYESRESLAEFYANRYDRYEYHPE